MEASFHPEDGPIKEGPEDFRPRPWLDKFKAWKLLIKNGCDASAGPGGIICLWIGRNCSFNDCPRRNFEQDELITESVIKVERQRDKITNLRQQLKQRDTQIKQLQKKGN